eukprot:gnl/MRDRNA2_/MRDRNA2_86145_c0_seq2.p1 gnl/MRDRNA2_/MRDRNA2_86145_c0~~gnl/MRDRNA2_/MRDRNA2_86145_c0_seq2.p1  ORF type:complete len:560 (+),score=98.80 gnl/MRDRNA2_/MRDRNA2_86145_c0_seq2:82-1680(+)
MYAPQHKSSLMVTCFYAIAILLSAHPVRGRAYVPSPSAEDHSNQILAVDSYGDVSMESSMVDVAANAAGASRDIAIDAKSNFLDDANVETKELLEEHLVELQSQEGETMYAADIDGVHTGDITIKVATFNVLSIGKSDKDPTGMFKFDAAAEPGFNFKKLQFLQKVIHENLTRDTDLVGLQEVDEDTENHLKTKYSAIFEVVEGPPCKSGNKPVDKSYLMYRKEKFGGHKCENFTDFMVCNMTLQDPANKKFTIVTGHSEKSGFTVGHKDFSKIVAAQPLILFGDFNTKTAEVKKALESTTTGAAGGGLNVFAFPLVTSSKTKKPTPTMRKSTYVFRSLLQAVSNTNNWEGWNGTCLEYNKIQDFTNYNENIKKYGDRWCSGDEPKSGKELEKAFESLVKANSEDPRLEKYNEQFPGEKPKSAKDAYTRFPMNKMWEMFFCIDEKCLTLADDQCTLAYGDECLETKIGQEDGIFWVRGLTAKDIKMIGPDREPDKTKDPPEDGYPNSNWMSDHFLLKATVTIPSDKLSDTSS